MLFIAKGGIISISLSLWLKSLFSEIQIGSNFVVKGSHLPSFFVLAKTTSAPPTAHGMISKLESFFVADQDRRKWVATSGYHEHSSRIALLDKVVGILQICQCDGRFLRPNLY